MTYVDIPIFDILIYYKLGGGKHYKTHQDNIKTLKKYKRLTLCSTRKTMVSCRFFPWFFYGFPLNQSIVAAIEAPPTEQEMPSAELDAQTAVIFDKASFSWSIEAGVYWIVMDSCG